MATAASTSAASGPGGGEMHVDDLVSWLKTLELAQYESLFREASIDPKELLTMTDEDLKVLGISNQFHRRKIMNRRWDTFGDKIGLDAPILSPLQEAALAARASQVPGLAAFQLANSVQPEQPTTKKRGKSVVFGEQSGRRASAATTNQNPVHWTARRQSAQEEAEIRRLEARGSESLISKDDQELLSLLKEKLISKNIQAKEAKEALDHVVEDIQENGGKNARFAAGDRKLSTKDIHKKEGEEVNYVENLFANEMDEHDFQLRVHIIEARELKARDKSGSSDPVCQILGMGQKVSTKKKKDTLNAYWDQLFFFEKPMTRRQFDLEKLTVAVYDANALSRNVLIGQFMFDFAFVYNKPGHELYQQWVALTDTTDKAEGIQGYLKLSITLLGPDDKAIPHDPKDDVDDTGDDFDLSSMVLTPPSVNQEPHMLLFRCYQAEDLPRMDLMGGSDPYIAVDFQGVMAKSKVIKSNTSPKWDEELQIPVMTPTMTDLIRIRVFDHDVGPNPDDLIATAYIRWSDIEKNPKGGVKWLNFYGAPGNKGGNENLMNTGMVSGSNYRGRLLYNATEKKAKDPKMSTGIKISSAVEPQCMSYVLHVDIYEAKGLPEGFMHKYDVRVKMGSYKFQTSAKKAHNGVCKWYTSMDEIKAKLPHDKKQLPDIFLIVREKGTLGSTRVAFLRFTPEEVWGFDSTPSWRLMMDEPGEGGKASREPPFLLFRIGFGPKEKAPKKRQEVKPPVLKPYQIRCHVYQARDLQSGDKGGTSDPYVVVRCADKKAKTKVKPQTNDPLWYELIVFDVELNENLELAGTVDAVLYDEDKIGRDEMLGRFTVDIADLPKCLEHPDWCSLSRTDGRPVAGEALMSLQLLTPEDARNEAIPASIAPTYKDCKVELYVLGCRGLEGIYLIGPQAPFVEFISPMDNTKVKTKKSSFPDGDNPNYLEVLSFNMKLPADTMFCPSINVVVTDYRLKGASKPTLGRCKVDTKDLVPWADHHDLQSDDEDDFNPDDPDSAIRNLEKYSRKSIRRLLGNQYKEEDYRPMFGDTMEDHIDQFWPLYPIKRGMNVSEVGKKKQEEEIVGDLKMICKISEKKNSRSGSKAVDFAKWKPRKYIIRVYIMECFNLAPADDNGLADPFIKMVLGGSVIVNDRKNHREKTLQPEIMTCYEFEAELPGESYLDIQVWDYDLVGDDLIGSTRIDLERRLFSQDFNKKYKMFAPIEHRPLMSESSSAPQGTLQMWMDIMTPDEAEKIPKEEIHPSEPMEYQLRVVIWNVLGLRVGADEKVNLYVKARVVGGDEEETDVHFMASHGEGHFNYRLLYDLVLPYKGEGKVARLKVSVFRKDITNEDDLLMEEQIDLVKFFEKAYNSKGSLPLSRQQIDMKHPDHPEQGIQGQVDLEMELLPKKDAEKRPAGKGRSSPNKNPHLPDPERDFNPFRLDKMLGNIFKKYKQYAIMIAIAVVAVVVVFGAVYVAVQFGNVPLPSTGLLEGITGSAETTEDYFNMYKFTIIAIVVALCVCIFVLIINTYFAFKPQKKKKTPEADENAKEDDEKEGKKDDKEEEGGLGAMLGQKKKKKKKKKLGKIDQILHKYRVTKWCFYICVAICGCIFVGEWIYAMIGSDYKVFVYFLIVTAFIDAVMFAAIFVWVQFRSRCAKHHEKLVEKLKKKKPNGDMGEPLVEGAGVDIEMAAVGKDASDSKEKAKKDAKLEAMKQKLLKEKEKRKEKEEKKKEKEAKKGKNGNENGTEKSEEDKKKEKEKERRRKRRKKKMELAPEYKFGIKIATVLAVLDLTVYLVTYVIHSSNNYRFFVAVVMLSIGFLFSLYAFLRCGYNVRVKKAKILDDDEELEDLELMDSYDKYKHLYFAGLACASLCLYVFGVIYINQAALSYGAIGDIAWIPIALLFSVIYCVINIIGCSVGRKIRKKYEGGNEDDDDSEEDSDDD